jgi:hypothetical protein
MSDAAIRAALEAATRALCFGADGADCDRCVDPIHCTGSALMRPACAAAITAFLRALPPGWHMDKARGDIAAAVEEAARDG